MKIALERAIGKEWLRIERDVARSERIKRQHEREATRLLSRNREGASLRVVLTEIRLAMDPVRRSPQSQNLISVQTVDEPLPGSQECRRNMLRACLDRANITNEGAFCAKREYGTTAPDLGHQQVAPTGENHFRALGT